MSVDKRVTKDLMETLADGRDGFEKAAERLADTDRSDLVETMREFSAQRATMHQELGSLAAHYGDDIDEEGSLAATLHRGWMAVKDTLAGSKDAEGVLDVAEQGEDHAVAEYKDALEKDISPDLRAVVERQAAAIQAAHDKVRALRDAAS